MGTACADKAFAIELMLRQIILFTKRCVLCLLTNEKKSKCRADCKNRKYI